MRWLRAVGLGLVLTTAAADRAAAQSDDWSVKRNPFDRRVIARWKAVVEKDPGDAAALRRLWNLYARHSTTDKLIAEYEARLEKQPDRPKLAILVGNLYRLRPDADRALEAYRKAAELAPDDPEPRLLAADILRQKQRKPEAAAAYEEALAVTRSPSEKKKVLRALADLALDTDDVEAAQRHFRTYIELDPNDVGARLDLGDALARHGKHDLALAEYQEAARRLGTDPARRVDTLARIGAELEALAREDEAIAIYRQAMELAGRGHHLRKQLTERIIDIYRKRQELRVLVALYEKEHPPASRGHFEHETLARLYEEIGDQDRALDAYRRAVAAAPAELDTQRRLIALLDRAGRDEEVVKQYEALIRVAPGEPRFRIELAERYFKRGDKARALAMLKDVGGHFPDDAGVHAALADLYSRWGEDARALREYETLTRIEPSDDTHLVNLGEQYFQKGDKAKAIEIWKRIAGPRTAESFARLGEVYAEHDLGAEAIEQYHKALALKPRDALLWKGLAGVLERQRSDERAIDAWERVMELTGDDPKDKALRREARTRIISILHRKSGTPLLAKTAEWARRFRGTPPDLEAGYRAAEAYIRRGQLADAERILAAILRLDPKDLDAKHQLVAVLKSQRKYQDAIDLLKELAVDEPGMERQYHSEIAELELALYHDEEAIAYARKVLEKSPNDPAAQERLAEIYAKRGDHAEAVAAYRRAVELDPRNFKVRFALAKLHLRAGQNRDAALLYREIIRKAGDEDVVRAAAKNAIDLEEYLGTLGELERELAPLSFLFAGKPTYRRILVELYDRYVPPLVARARLGDEAAEKELARLGEHGLKPLLEALEDIGDAVQARVAVRVLGFLGNRAAAPPLVKLALDATPFEAAALPGAEGVEMDLRVEALVAAGRLGDPRLVKELAALLGHREVALREAAAWALGQTRSGKALEPLLAALADPRPSVHALACLGLGRLGERRALDRAAEVMRDATRSVETRAACAYALGAARSAAHLGALAEVAASGNDETQLKAAWALGRIADARAIPLLLRALPVRGAAVREALLWALARSAAGGDAPEDLPPPRLEDLRLENGKLDHRQLVRELPGELPPVLPPPGVVRGRAADLAAGFAEALAQDGRRDLVVRALADLDARDDGVALGPLTRELDTLPEGERREVRAVADSVGRAVAARLDALCAHVDPEVRARALAVLAKLGDARAGARLAAATGDADPDVRLAALAASRRWLATPPGGEHAPTSAQLASLATAVAARLGTTDGPGPGDDRWRERAAAAEALRAMPAPAQAALAGALTDPSGFVREAAAVALAPLAATRGAELVAPLVVASRDESAEVRAAAAAALAGSADPQARARARELAEGDPSPAVRAAAAGKFP
jgi:tetratricopeptide (TPR) repeat protein